MSIKIYEYAGCSTCKQALKFLNDRKISYEKIAIVENPPSPAELKRMLSYLGGNIRKLFNTSGQVYREMGLGEKMAAMSEAEAFRFLSANGKLVKRPFLLTANAGVVGFKEEAWENTLKFAREQQRAHL